MYETGDDGGLGPHRIVEAAVDDRSPGCPDRAGHGTGDVAGNLARQRGRERQGRNREHEGSGHEPER